MNDSFEQFWDKLVDDERWYDFTKMRFNRKNLKECAKDCYAFLLATPSRWNAQDYQDFRKCFLNFLKNAKDAPVGPTLQQVEVKVEQKPQEPPLTGAERLARIKEWEALVKKTEPVKAVGQLTHKQIAEEGGWDPKRPDPYPKTNESEIRKKAIHQEYIRSNYDPRTGDKLPGWTEEEPWTESLTETEITEIIKAFLKLK
jgi:2,4-dienoyl-CoA reductase-like NADH-dependent reductase (Old Yellow Enzyme family)